MDYPESDSTDEMIYTFCVACDLPLPVNNLGLCDNCFAKLERDLIRSRDWDYSVTAFGVEPNQLEALRERVIREYGADYELIEDPNAKKPKRKNKCAHSRNTQRRREIAAKAICEYDTDAVLQSARDFIRELGEEWVNFSRLSQHLYETFYKLKPKHLRPKSKKYKSLLKFIADYPDDFEVRQDEHNKGVYWVRFSNVQTKEDICDVFDEVGERTGQTATRGTQLQPGEYYLVVQVWLRNGVHFKLVPLRRPSIDGENHCPKQRSG